MNTFDILLAVALFAGAMHGFKRGMSHDLLDLLKWLSVVLAGAGAYKFVGKMLARDLEVFGPLSAYLVAYLATGLVVFVLFAFLKEKVGDRLLLSNAFGRLEYYLGALSGLIRAACMVMAVLALLNARHFTVAEAQASMAAQRNELGNSFFPTLFSIQTMVFDHSLSGSWIYHNLNPLLIERTDRRHRMGLSLAPS